MGMYSIMTEKKSLTYKKRELSKTDIGDSLLLLFEWQEVKFYGYWTTKYLNQMADYGKKGIIKGEIIIHYEEGDIIKCKWDKDGFHYAIGIITFPTYISEEETK